MTTNHWRPENEFVLTEVGPALWLVRHPLAFFGFKMTTCMTIVRLSTGGLWLHSPVPIDQALKSRIDALGTVEFIVAPNRSHHLYALDCLRQFPQARLYVAPGLAGKNPAFGAYPVVPVESEAPWRADIEGVFIDGNVEMNETVFFHKLSRMLIVSDLVVHMGPWDAFMTRAYARLTGVYDRLGLSSVLKKFYGDRAAARKSIQQVLSWDFSGIVLAHGPLVKSDARSKLEAAFAWL